MLYVSSVSCSAHTSCKGVHILLFTAERSNNFFYKQSSLKEAVPQICALEKIAVLYTGLFFLIKCAMQQILLEISLLAVQSLQSSK